jgi:hypothetical protein
VTYEKGPNQGSGERQEASRLLRGGGVGVPGRGGAHVLGPGSLGRIKTFNYEPAFSAIGSRGSYYAAEAPKIGIAAGAVLTVADALSGIEGWNRAATLGQKYLRGW